MGFGSQMFGQGMYGGGVLDEERRKYPRIEPRSWLVADLAIGNTLAVSAQVNDISQRGISLKVPLRDYARVTKENQSRDARVSFAAMRDPVPMRIAKFVHQTQIRQPKSSEGHLRIGVSCVFAPDELDLLLGFEHKSIVYESKAQSKDVRQITGVVVTANDQIKAYFAKHPERIHTELSSRQFEELIADVLKDLGFDVELTRSTRDGGFDIYAHVRNQVFEFLTLVECKRYAPDRGVGVGIVRSVYGAHTGNNTDRGLIVTTSYFTRPAIEETQRLYRTLGLADFEQLKTWLRKY